MANPEVLKALCYDDAGGVKPRPECRSTLINHLILEDSMDVDEAEDVADNTLNELALWPAESTPTEDDGGETLPEAPPSA
jgi:hypothetical protein